MYFGTPEMAVPALDALVAAGFDVALVVTRPDKRRGRGNGVTPSPVKAAAQRHSIPVSHDVADSLEAGADLGVVVAFGQLIRESVLERLPMVNLHFSLLPRWRGAAPVERAILAGDSVTGVSLMQVDVGLDTGGVIDVVEVPIGTRQTADQLRRQLAGVGSRQLVQSLASGLGPAAAQTGVATLAPKLDPAEFAIEWIRPAVEIDRLIRLGVAWSTFRGKRLKILQTQPPEPPQGTPAAGIPSPGSFIGPITVACGTGSLVLHTVQPEGRPAMDATAWSNGARPATGERIGPGQ